MKTNFQRKSIGLTSTPVIVNIMSLDEAGKRYEASSAEKPIRMSPTNNNANINPVFWSQARCKIIKILGLRFCTPAPPINNIWAMMFVWRYKRDYQNCSLLYCVLKLCTVISTLRWAVLTILWIGFCHTGWVRCLIEKEIKKGTKESSWVKFKAFRHLSGDLINRIAIYRLSKPGCSWWNGCVRSSRHTYRNLGSQWRCMWRDPEDRWSMDLYRGPWVKKPSASSGMSSDTFTYVTPLTAMAMYQSGCVGSGIPPSPTFPKPWRWTWQLTTSTKKGRNKCINTNS